jgi:hypothetical protein
MQVPQDRTTGGEGQAALPSDKRLLHPAWYLLPLALYLVLAYGDPLILARIPVVESVAGWLQRQDSVQGNVPPVQSVARAASLLMMPLQLVGIFWVLWPMRWWNVKVYRDRNARPPAMLELACLAYFFGGGYVHYFLNPPTRCAFCPTGTGGIAAMEAVVLFTFSYAAYGVVETLHTRIALASSR